MNLDPRLQPLVDWTKETLGLDAYELHAAHIRAEQMMCGVLPVFSMEWFPKGMEFNREEGTNPDGTAVVDVDLCNRLLRSVIFVGGQTFANKLCFDKQDVNRLIGWVRQKAGLDEGQPICLQKQEGERFVFQSHIDGIPIHPGGQIELELDDRGRLVLFTVHGEFPDKSRIQFEDDFPAMDEGMEKLAFGQLKLLTIPLVQQQKWINVYMLEELFVSRDPQTVLPFTLDGRARIPVHRVVKWDDALDEQEGETMEERFALRPLFPDEKELSLDQAMKLAEVSGPFRLSEEERQAVMDQATRFVRCKFPQDNGKWTLQTISRTTDYVIAELGASTEDDCFVAPKLKIFLDDESFEVVNYIERNELFKDLFASFAPPEPVNVGKEEAFERIQQRMLLSPAYVYDWEQDRYVLCGKLDCKFGVLASSGEVVALDDLI